MPRYDIAYNTTMTIIKYQPDFEPRVSFLEYFGEN